MLNETPVIMHLPAIAVASSSYLQLLSIDQILFHERQHKLYIMGITSLWLVMPILFGVCAQPSQKLVHMALVSWTVIVCIISTASFWYIGKGSPQPNMWIKGYHHYKIMQIADKLCAPVMFIVLVIFFAAGFGARTLSCWITVGVIPGAVVIFFLGSRFFELVQPNTLAATWCHLTFRYIGFWWVYFALTPPTVEQFGFSFSFAIDSTLYWGHIGYSVFRTGRRGADFRLSDDYIRGCMEVLTLNIVLYLTHRITTSSGESCAIS